MGIEVVCGILLKDGRVWMGQRPSHKERGGYYEFPGGKVNDNESPEEALRRELKEELDIEVTVGPMLAEVNHQYPDKTIHLKAFVVETEDEIKLLEHTRQRWVQVGAVSEEDWATADRQLWERIKID